MSAGPVEPSGQAQGVAPVLLDQLVEDGGVARRLVADVQQPDALVDRRGRRRVGRAVTPGHGGHRGAEVARRDGGRVNLVLEVHHLPLPARPGPNHLAVLGARP